MPTTAKTAKYHAILIGAGQGGKPLSLDLAKAGWKTALVERALLGGTCINYGCTPTKTMVASARTAYLARRGRDYGVETGDVSVDILKVRDRKRKIVESFRGGIERAVGQAENLDFFHGEARFVSAHEIEVTMEDGNKRMLSSDTIVIDTGTRPAFPQLKGIDRIPFLDSTSIMELDALPEHLIVLGGGYVGLEFGQMFRRFGSDVTIIERGEQVLGREDADIAREIAVIFEEDGINLLLEASALEAHQRDDGTIDLTVSGADELTRVITGSHLLVASGRVPNVEGLNLNAAGVSMDKRGFVKVNDRLETTVKGVYAIGDVKGGPAFTHISYDDYRILKENLLNKGSATTANRMVPYTVFIDPQLGRVGLSESEARAEGLDFEVASIPMKYVARALETDEDRGLMKVIVDKKSGQILGCAVLGVDGGELMNMLQIAMMGKLPFTALRDATFAHPTLGESLNTLFMGLNG